ncbi:hypothetical protein K439DRAFT_827281 [Ramaria rubella]|nr:hypothetical protein K439DRAFT_827281 [Ramaria rubella]
MGQLACQHCLGEGAYGEVVKAHVDSIPVVLKYAKLKEEAQYLLKRGQNISDISHGKKLAGAFVLWIF